MKHQRLFFHLILQFSLFTFLGAHENVLEIQDIPLHELAECEAALLLEESPSMANMEVEIDQSDFPDWAQGDPEKVREYYQYMLSPRAIGYRAIACHLGVIVHGVIRSGLGSFKRLRYS